MSTAKSLWIDPLAVLQRWVAVVGTGKSHWPLTAYFFAILKHKSLNKNVEDHEVLCAYETEHPQ